MAGYKLENELSLKLAVFSYKKYNLIPRDYQERIVNCAVKNNKGIVRACTGSGIGPTKIDRVIGIVKAYTTRVGSGPFPTELFDEDGEKLRSIGGEVGVTTGRARRCGWFDAPIARYAVRVNGLTDFFLTKLDVLTGWEKIPVCVAYEIDGKRVEELPASQTDFHHAKPIYEYLPGWTEDISHAKKISDLPKNAQEYIAFLEKISGAPMSAIGVGPGRDQTIVVRDFI